MVLMEHGAQWIQGQGPMVYTAVVRSACTFVTGEFRSGRWYQPRSGKRQRTVDTRSRHRWWGWVSLACFLPALVPLSGCGSNFNALPAVNMGQIQQTPLGNIKGSTYGGQQPVWQSHVYLMKAGTAGYGSASTSILTASANTVADTTVLGTPSNPAYYIVTDYGGNFNLTGDYTCSYNATTPSQSDQLYVLSLSGNDTYLPGPPATGGATNAYIGLMAVLGQCPSDGTFADHLSFVYVNEISTVAAAYALAGFAGNSSSIGSGSSALAQVGLANAFANAAQLYEIQGTAPGHEARTVTPNGNGTVSNLVINTLGNTLAACINQGATALIPLSGACQTLYNDSGHAPDVASAMIYIAQHPGLNVPALYTLPGSTLEFADVLTTQPKDFTVGISYAGSPLSAPVDVAVDGSGNAWVTSSAGLSKMSPLGVPASGFPVTLPAAAYVALDPAGDAWVTSLSGNSVYEFSSAGVAVTGAPYTDAGILVAPLGVAGDGAGHIYVAASAGFAGLLALSDPAGSVFKISGSGASATYANYADTLAYLGLLYNYIPTPTQVALDSTGHVWVSGDVTGLLGTGNNVARLEGNTGLVDFNTPGCLIGLCNIDLLPPIGCVIFSCSNLASPEGIAIDANGNGWVAFDTATPVVGKVSATGAVNEYGGGGLSTPFGVAIDGSGNVWVANVTGNSLSEFTSAGVAVTGTSGYIGGSTSMLSGPKNLDIDESGDVWVVNTTGNTLTEFIGMATPTLRPLSVAVASSTLASKP